MKERFKIKSIRTKLLISIIPLIIIAFLSVALVVAQQSKVAITKEISDKIQVQVELSKNQIGLHLSSHKLLPIMLAETVESVGITPSTQISLTALIKETPDKNEDTLGTGIFMANQYEGNWYCPYAYKVDGKITYTTDYFVDNTTQGWYVIGETPNLSAWSAPYYDGVSGITMVTATSPIRDASGKLIGVATGDLDFTNIQKIVGDVTLGEKSKGFAMLITTDGSYIAKKGVKIEVDKDGNFPNMAKDENASLASVAKEIIDKKEGLTHYTDANGKNLLYYSTIAETGWIVCISIPESEINQPVNAILLKIIMVTLGAIFVAAILVVVVAQRMAKPILELHNSVSMIADGNLTHVYDVHGFDEIGHMGRLIENMRQNLNDMIRDMSATSGDVASASLELSASAEQNGFAAEQIAQSVTEISESTVDIRRVASIVSTASNNVIDMLKTMNDGIEKISHLLKNVDIQAQSGNSVVQSAVKSMDETELSITKSTAAMHELSDQSKEINGIIDAIKQIANQTNLLALNASIEAARAGEAGRGFAVVADEIRKLAEQSNVSAEQISSIINTIQTSVESTVDTSRESSTLVVQTGKMVQTAGVSFKEIAGSIEAVVSQMTQVITLVNELQKNADSMSVSVHNMDSITTKTAEESQTIAAAAEEQSATTVEMATASEGLTVMASDLQKSIQKFKI